MVIAVQSVHADPIADHPAKEELNRAFTLPAPSGFQATGIKRDDYLKLIAGNVDFFLKCQNEKGAIIDPFSKGERQYSTPAFAASAGLLVKEAGRSDLLDPACRAMTHALTALVEKHSADGHSDFYIPLLVHAHRFLKDAAPADQVKHWEELFRKIDPTTMYNAKLRGMNWNVVSCSGELLRRHDGLIADDRKDAQMKYLESCLNGHMKTLNRLGLFEDPGFPMAYDAFSRLWLDDMQSDNAYTGVHEKEIESFLRQGGLSTLLMLSPSGEWLPGGRSALHSWNEAEILAICEMNANYWKKQGRDDVAGAFKRAAHLAYQSMARWQRPTGELWIIKNRAEPETRFAYEGYSNHSQYNLLPMAMLAIAYSRADESIAEKVSPMEVGGYVFDLRKGFHKIVAGAAGYYVVIDTAADPHYNATGLQRVQRAGVGFSALSDSAPIERAYGPKEVPNIAMAPGVQWKSSDQQWIGLANFSGDAKSKHHVADVKLTVKEASPAKTTFDVTYQLAGEFTGSVSETYTIDASGVTVAFRAPEKAAGYRLQFPVLVNNGASDVPMKVENNTLTITEQGSITRFDAPADAGAAITVEKTRTMNHNGYLDQAVVPTKDNTSTLTISLQQP